MIGTEGANPKAHRLIKDYLEIFAYDMELFGSGERLAKAGISSHHPHTSELRIGVARLRCSRTARILY